jgi:hypothetical protein
MCSIVLHCEQNYSVLEPIIKYISEQVLLNLQNGSDTSSSSSGEQEEGEDELSEEDGEGFSEREALQNVHQPLDLV